MLELNLGDAVVRELDLTDAPSLARHADDRRIWLQVRDALPHPYLEAHAVAYIESVRAQKPPTTFAIAVDGQAVGAIGLTMQTDVNRVSAELGYWLGAAYWGRGLATRAVSAVTRWGIDELRLTRVFATPFAENLASCRVLEKAGFVREGVMRRSAVDDGRLLDQVMYACVA
jgi:RimJ/RimL family protein N-acetyltransferase